MLSTPFAIYVGILFVTSCVGSVVAFYIYKAKDSVAAKWYVCTGVSMVWWALFGAAHVIGAGVGENVSTLKYIVMLTIGGAWLSNNSFLIFVLYYVRKEKPSRVLVGGILGIYLVQLGLSLTDPVHGLLWNEFTPAEEPFRHLAQTTTSLYDSMIVVDFLLYCAALALLARHIMTMHGFNSKQLAAVAATPIAPWAAVIGGRVGLYPSDLEMSAAAALVGFVVLGYALTTYDLLEFRPVAREVAFNTTDDAIVIISDTGAIVDYNRAAGDVFPSITDHVGDKIDVLNEQILIEGFASDGGAVGSGESFETGSQSGLATASRQSLAGSAGEHTAVDETVPDPSDSSDIEFAAEMSIYQGGEEIVLEISPSPVEIGGQTRAYTILFRDVTTERERSEQYRREREQLDQFVSTVSHDLRNPLSIAEGYIKEIDKILERENVNDQHPLDPVSEVEASLTRMEQMIEDSLELARNGRAIEEPSRQHLSQTVTHAWQNTKPVRTGPATVVNQIPSDLSVSADHDRLSRVFENLFRNAVDHGPDDATVTVRWDADAQAIHVDDNGPGIPQPVRDDLFEEGVTTGERGSGAGLGLSVVKQVVKAHGWSVRVSESPAGGARFTINSVDTVETE